jgi:hypothetical protein
VKRGTVIAEVGHHINSFCNIRDPKKKQYIIKKLSKTLSDTAKAELGRKIEGITFSSVLYLAKQYLFRLRAGFCIHDKRQDGYILLNDEFIRMQKNKQTPQNLCDKCISPRVCKLRSALMNDNNLAGLFTNIKKFT